MVLGFLKGFYVNEKRKQTNFEQKIKDGIKIHTIREDRNKRWKDGNKIHFATGVRSSNYNCFKEGKCRGVQEIKIENRMVWVDEVLLSYLELETLAKNDGFDSTSDFWGCFDNYSPFEGRLIHWTNLLY